MSDKIPTNEEFFEWHIRVCKAYRAGFDSLKKELEDIKSQLQAVRTVVAETITERNEARDALRVAERDRDLYEGLADSQLDTVREQARRIEKLEGIIASVESSVSGVVAK